MHGGHRPILVIYDRGRVFALDNRCPHMGFPLERGSVEDGILTCHWHHARFDLASGCTFDLWADDVPVCPVEVRNGDVWVKTTFRHADPAAHWRQRFGNALAHNLGLVIAKAVQSQLAADVPRADIVRQVALFGVKNRDGWDVGLTFDRKEQDGIAKGGRRASVPDPGPINSGKVACDCLARGGISATSGSSRRTGGGISIRFISCG